MSGVLKNEATLRDPLVVRSLVDTIVDRLEAAIIKGELAPGTRLSEVQLAASLGVSRGPLREAIQRLEGRRLIERTPYVGARVVVLSREDLGEILLAREALEGMAARLAAERMERAEIEALREVIRHRERHADSDPARLQDPAQDFHHLVVAGCRNRWIAEMLSNGLQYLLRVYRYRSSIAPGRVPESAAEHAAIVDAIAARDGDRAEALMREHLRHARENLMRRLESIAPAGGAAEPGGRGTKRRPDRTG